MKARKVRGLEPARPLAENAARIVGVRLDELRGFADSALKPSQATAQHDMRIAAKRLRYVLEIVGPCFGEEAERVQTGARELQGLLGEIHDCDVMAAETEGIESVQEILRGRRAKLHAEFGRLWRDAEMQGALDRLASAVA
jgi:CHAD domain-containing protein